MAEAKSVDLTEGALETEQHVGIPQKLVKEKAKIQDLGQQKAHFHRDQNANSNALHRRREKAKGKDQGVLLKGVTVPTLLLFRRMGHT